MIAQIVGLLEAEQHITKRAPRFRPVSYRLVHSRKGCMVRYHYVGSTCGHQKEFCQPER